MTDKAAFLKAFASIPSALRSEIVAVIDNQPYTWEAIFVEVQGDTIVAKKLIHQLREIHAI